MKLIREIDLLSMLWHCDSNLQSLTLLAFFSIVLSVIRLYILFQLANLSTVLLVNLTFDRTWKTCVTQVGHALCSYGADGSLTWRVLHETRPHQWIERYRFTCTNISFRKR